MFQVARRFSKFLIAIFLVAVAGLALGTAYSLAASYEPSETALDALVSDSFVSVTTGNRLIVFAPVGTTPETGLIFYPGGLVDFRAYAPVLRRIASQGYSVFTPAMPLNLAFLDSNAADKIISEHPEIMHWVIGGHSLGGVAAASYTEQSTVIEGVIFWASYPQGAGLRDRSIKALSIYGTHDGLISSDQINRSRDNLPAETLYIAIEGGNHAQFGSYGLQNGDNISSISPEMQFDRIAAITSAFLAEISD